MTTKKLKYPNLAAEMARHGLSYEDVYETTAKAVGKSTETVRSWVCGRAGELTVKAAFFIRDTYFPGMDMAYLFDTEPQLSTN